MPRKKRTLKEIDSDSEEEIQSPPRKKSRRIQNKKQEQEEEEKKMFDLEVTEIETIAIIAPSPNKIRGSSKIAAFDMDWTLIQPKSGKKFPQNRKDWIWMYPNKVTSKLKEIHNNGYQIVIFSNQNGIGSGKQSLDSVSGKIMDLSQELKIPIFGFLSIQKDHWRKPNTLMWDYFVSHYNNNVMIDYSASFYCGDAAGRPKGWRDSKTKKDFSCSDRKFAHNIGVIFHTPEPYFLGEQENKTWKWLSLNPSKYIETLQASKDAKNWFHGALPIANKDKLDMVMMRGCPGCGKSSFAQKYLIKTGRYEWVNRDTLKTKKKCLDFTKNALKNGKSVVVDNTNPDYNAREPFIKIGKQFKANIRLFNMNTDREVAEHMNLARERISNGECKRIPTIAYNMYFKKVRQDDVPSIDEGFNEIVNIDFIPDFKDDKTKKLWMQFT